MISLNQQEQELTRLPEPRPCSIVFATQDAVVFCGKPAHWAVDGGPVCMHDIRNMAGMNSDNETFFAEPLQEGDVV